MGLLSLSQSGYLKMWNLSKVANPILYLSVDCLFHVGNCASVLLLGYKRNGVPKSANSEKSDNIDDGDMLIAAGDTKLAFLNPYDVQRPVLRRLEVEEGILCVAQWRNLLMLGTKTGAIIGSDL